MGRICVGEQVGPLLDGVSLFNKIPFRSVWSEDRSSLRRGSVGYCELRNYYRSAAVQAKTTRRTTRPN